MFEDHPITGPLDHGTAQKELQVRLHSPNVAYGVAALSQVDAV